MAIYTVIYTAPRGLAINSITNTIIAASILICVIGRRSTLHTGLTKYSRPASAHSPCCFEFYGRAHTVYAFGTEYGCTRISQRSNFFFCVHFSIISRILLACFPPWLLWAAAVAAAEGSELSMLLSIISELQRKHAAAVSELSILLQ